MICFRASSKIFNRLLFLIIRFSPSNTVRIWIYRNCFKYKIGRNVTILGSIINSKKVEIGDNVFIGRKNFIRSNQLFIGAGTKIEYGNTIFGKADFKIGTNSRIIHNHYIDLWNDVEIGHDTWLAGKKSQLWTHGSIHTKTEVKDLSIKIGNNVYIGANSSIAPGVDIADLNLIALGSVVVNTISSSKNIVMGNPSKVVKSNIDWRKNW